MKITDDAAARAIERVMILACGTSWHAALVGKFLIEQLARIPVEVDYGSEFRYRDPIVDAEHAGRRHHAVGRDGRHAGGAARGQDARAPRSIAICNVVGSMATREADGTHLHARRAGDRRRVDQGVHVAAGRAATCSALHLGQVRGALTPRRRKPHIDALLQLPLLLEQTLKLRRRRSRRSPARFHTRTRLPVPRPRHQLPDRARRRAEAEGDLLHPRRGLSGRRDEARADRAHRRADAGRRDRAARRRLREDDRQHPGGEGARRLGHRADDRAATTSCARSSIRRATSSSRCRDAHRAADAAR